MCTLNITIADYLHDIRILRMIYHPVKYHDITKYHDMYNNGDYGASFHYMYIQSSYSNSGAESRHSYVMPYCQHYMLPSIYQGNKI